MMPLCHGIGARLHEGTGAVSAAHNTMGAARGDRGATWGGITTDVGAAIQVQLVTAALPPVCGGYGSGVATAAHGGHRV
jgi:hypothetical protein